MSQAIAPPQEPVHRHRHRTRRRKLLESMGLMFGVPLLLFVVLALSVELIEYRPVTLEISSEPDALQPTGTSGQLRTTPGMPKTVLEIPPIGMDSLKLDGRSIRP